MTNELIPTAEEIIFEIRRQQLPSVQTKLLVDFTAMHVKAALEEAVKKATENGSVRADLIKIIPDSYPLENIK